MGATDCHERGRGTRGDGSEHLAYFSRQRERLASPDVAAGLEDFYASQYFGENAFRDMLNEDDEFFDINRREDLIAYNSTFLRNHPDLIPHSIDEMFVRAEAIVGHAIDREE